ncbi:hypothetical protein ACJ5NV_14320 [Loktanella agnita]|uniref:hypothetical protein n=1 Tax=Loktanella agnita TaxID=287097 RepID=UPI003986E8F0
MMMTDPNDDMLEDLFDTARRLAPPVSDDLMTRVLADAVVDRAPAQVARPCLWARLSDMLGGWPALGGLATATIAGVWVGIAPPAQVEALTDDLIGQSVSVSLFSDSAFLDEELFADG